MATGNGYTGGGNTFGLGSGSGTVQPITIPSTSGNYGQSTSSGLQQAPAQTSSPQIGPSSLSSLQSSGLIGSIGNPNADAIHKVHTATLKALNTPSPTVSDPLISSMGTALTPAQIAAKQGTPMVSQGNGNMAPQFGGAPSSSNGSTGTNTATGIIGTLMSSTAKNQAEQTALTQQEQALQAKYAVLGGDLINSPLAGGANGIGSARQAQLSNTEQSALANMQQEQARLAGYQTQAQGAAGTALGALTSTTQTPYGTPVVYTATGQPVGGAGATGTTGTGGFTPTYNPTVDAQNFGTAVMNGTMTYAQAVSDMAYTSIGKNTLDQAITKMGGDPLSLEAQGAATQSNIQTTGTASTGSWNTIYQNANSAYATYSQQQSAINNIANQTLSIMQSAGINPSDSQYANVKLNQFATQFSSPQYAAFNTAITTLQARVAKALQAGEIPTAATTNATAIANGDTTIGALAATMQQVNNEMTAFVGTQKSLADYAKQQMGTTGSTNTSGSTTPMFGSFNG